MIYADYGLAETFQLKLASGRFFSRQYESDENNFVLNETAVQDMNVADPLNMEMTISGQHGRIIGILKDFHFSPLHNKVQPLVVMLQPVYYRYAAVKIQSENIPSTIGYIEHIFKRFSPKYPFEYNFLDEMLEESYRAEQRSQSLLKYFVLLAVFISCMGLFGLASFMAERRTKEIGIRKVLGASEAGIFVLLSRSFVIWVLISNFIAWPLAYFIMNQWLHNFAYRTPISWLCFVTAGFISLAIALFTVSWQSIRVARRDPVQTIKYE
jgi:putative ABC transport system permease protein